MGTAGLTQRNPWRIQQKHHGPTNNPRIHKQLAPLSVLGTHIEMIQIQELHVQEWTRLVQQHPQCICRGSCNNVNSGVTHWVRAWEQEGLLGKQQRADPQNWHAAGILATKARTRAGNKYNTTVGWGGTWNKLNSNKIHQNKNAKVSFEDHLLKYKPTWGANKVIQGHIPSLNVMTTAHTATWTKIKKLNSGVRVRGVINSKESVKFKLANIYKIKSQWSLS